MTPAPATPTGSGLTLIWDASALHHAIKANKVDILADMASCQGGVPRHNLTTATVLDEISHHRLPVAGLDWLETVHVDGLDELAALVDWMGRVSGQKSNQGEATVLAWAEVHNAVAVIDDRDAVRVGRAGGLEIWGSLRLIAESVRDGRTTEYVATTFVDSLMSTGMRYPCPAGGFVSWAKQNNLL